MSNRKREAIQFTTAVHENPPTQGQTSLFRFSGVSLTAAKRLLVAAVMAMVGAACTQDASHDVTTTEVAPPEHQSTTTTTQPTPPDPWDPAADWHRDVVAPAKPGQFNAWYEDIAVNAFGQHIAVGVAHDGLLLHPAAWITESGRNDWKLIDIPDLEGWFNSVASDEGVTVMVGYDTADGAGVIVKHNMSDGLVEEVPFDEDVDLADVVATDSGFVAYGIRHPNSQNADAVAFSSEDGSSWVRVDNRWLGGVVDAVAGPDDWILEVPNDARATVQMVRAPLMSGEADGEGQQVVWIELEASDEVRAPYVLTAAATKSGFLLGGGDLATGRPAMWSVTPPVTADGAGVAELIEFEMADDSSLGGGQIEVRHLAVESQRVFAVLGQWSAETEIWSSSDLTTWTVEAKAGVDPSAFRYASATFTSPRAPEEGEPAQRTLLVTRTAMPSDLWALGNRVRNLSHLDRVAPTALPVPLFIGWADERLYARVVEHAPRWSQTESDRVRSRLYEYGDSWREVGATAWDHQSRIQSVVAPDEEPLALATAVHNPGLSTNETYRLEDGRLGPSSLLQGAELGVEMFSAVTTPDAAIVVATTSSGFGDRFVALSSSDLVTWGSVTISGTRDAYIDAFCAGLGRAWIMGHQGQQGGTTATAWTSTDGRDWTEFTPAPDGVEPASRFAACGGDSDRVAAAVIDEPWLLVTEDGLNWGLIPVPDLLTGLDSFIEVAVDGGNIAVIVANPGPYYQPENTALVWDGSGWHELDPEPGAVYHSVALRDGQVFLAGYSVDGSTIWSTSGESLPPS